MQQYIGSVHSVLKWQSLINLLQPITHYC